MKPFLTLNVFTDPQCPFAYSAEPTRWRLLWLYGDQIQWNTTMIVLSGYQDEVPSITAEQSAEYQLGIREQYGMPINAEVRPRQALSILAATAYVAVERHDAAKATQFLRNLRIAAMSGPLLDEQTIIDQQAAAAGVTADALAKWVAEPTVQELVAQHAERARTPGSLTQAFAHKLSKTSTGRVRYSAPSTEFIIEGDVVAELPGMWSLETYEAVIGNLVPSMVRASNPDSVTQILEWAQTPLATQEVAIIYGKSVKETRPKLEDVADFTPVGQDGFWSLKR